MRMRPHRMNAAIASLFMVGSACFVLGSVAGLLNAVGGVVDGVTYFVGSLFFTSASFLQLLQAQCPSMTEAKPAPPSPTNAAPTNPNVRRSSSDPDTERWPRDPVRRVMGHAARSR